MPPKFTSPRVNLYQSDAGFSVEVLGRVGLRYVEGDRVMQVASEVLATPDAMAMWSSSIVRWDPPDEGVAVTDQERQRIIENIRLAFESQGYKLEVISRA